MRKLLMMLIGLTVGNTVFSHNMEIGETGTYFYKISDTLQQVGYDSYLGENNIAAYNLSFGLLCIVPKEKDLEILLFDKISKNLLLKCNFTKLFPKLNSALNIIYVDNDYAWIDDNESIKIVRLKLVENSVNVEQVYSFNSINIFTNSIKKYKDLYYFVITFKNELLVLDSQAFKLNSTAIDTIQRKNIKRVFVSDDYIFTIDKRDNLMVYKIDLSGNIFPILTKTCEEYATIQGVTDSGRMIEYDSRKNHYYFYEIINNKLKQDQRLSLNGKRAENLNIIGNFIVYYDNWEKKIKSVDFNNQTNKEIPGEQWNIDNVEFIVSDEKTLCINTDKYIYFVKLSADNIFSPLSKYDYYFNRWFEWTDKNFFHDNKLYWTNNTKKEITRFNLSEGLYINDVKIYDDLFIIKITNMDMDFE